MEDSATVTTEVSETTDINSLADLVPALRELGYRARPTDEGVLVGITQVEDDGSSRDFLMMVTEENGNLEFNCQLCTIGELQENHDENSLAALSWVFLALNTEIQPWGVGLINPDGELDETDTVVLTDSVPLGDFSRDELEKAMVTLERSLAAVTPAYVK